MAPDSRNIGDADVALHSGGHSPQNIVAVENIDILIDQDNIFQFRVSRQRNQRRLRLTSFVL